MNYRHHFHAGNFADLIKHAGLLTALGQLTRAPEPLRVIDTHAGAGAYDLAGEMPRKSGEAALGITRLMDDRDAPAAFDALKAAVARANADADLKLYPGSPLLARQALRAKDQLVACELRPDDAESLRRALGGPGARVEVICADGFQIASERLSAAGRNLVLIDPPYERPDDYRRIAATLGAVLARDPRATVMVWAPLKDLETFDQLLRGIETLDAPATLVAETRLRPLNDPMRMNGCALTVTNAPSELAATLRAAGEWLVAALGDRGGEARVWTL